ncbi:MAG: rod shape-determining protein MreC [Bdellovibrionia bacterium]
MALVVLILPLVSINMQQRPQESQWYTRPFTLLASTVQSGIYSFSNGVQSTTATYLDLIGIKKFNAELRSQNQELLTRLNLMNELSIENERLKKLLDFKQNTPMELTAAQVVGRDLVPDHNTITINKGTQHGLKAGMAVITTQGVLGYIFRPELLSSQVMLITDRYSVVDGIIARTRAQGIVEGKSSTSLVLKYVEKTADVKEGDLVVTGGLDNIFPKGFPIAVVDSIERKTYSISLRIELKPVIDPRMVEEVFVVTSAKGEDFTPIFAPPTEEAKTETDSTTEEAGAPQ